MSKKSKPIVAIVGRPNVGKSALFNAIVGKRISIVEDTPGVTRDRIYADTSWLNYEFTLIDTGGIEPESKDIIFSQMREQAQIAIDMADVILFVVDIQSGLQDADGKVADMLRKSQRPVVLTVNKVDQPVEMQPYVYEFYNLGIGDPIPVSAVNRTGIGDLLDVVVSYFPKDAGNGEDEEDNAVRIAIIGKPNVGKSSIVNRLIGENRVIVSDIPGTTRDAIDTRVRHDGKDYIFTDTAGLRRQKKISGDLEYYMMVRAVAAVERSDMAMVVIDATQGVAEQDAKIAGIAHDRGKAIIIAVNKWDAVTKDTNTMNEFSAQIRRTLSFIPYAEILYISALTGQRMNRIYAEVDKVSESQNIQIATGTLNAVLTEAEVMQQPPADKGKMLRIYYGTQTGVKPPTFVLFVNDKKLMHFSYLRYLENQIRKTFGLVGTPIKFIIRERNEE